MARVENAEMRRIFFIQKIYWTKLIEDIFSHQIENEADLIFLCLNNLSCNSVIAVCAIFHPFVLALNRNCLFIRYFFLGFFSFCPVPTI